METIDKYLMEGKISADAKKAWDEFEKIAKKELGSNWDGGIKGEHIYGGKLSKKAVELYKKYFNLL